MLSAARLLICWLMMESTRVSKYSPCGRKVGSPCFLITGRSKESRRERVETARCRSSSKDMDSLVSGQLLVVGCWLLVVGCWLLVVGCWLLVVGCWLLVVGCWKMPSTSPPDNPFHISH